MKKYLIFLLIAIFSIPFTSEMYATTSTGTTMKTSVKKKVVIKKPVKKVVKKSLKGSEGTWSTTKKEVITLNKSFKLWNIEYTILSLQVFDKVWMQSDLLDYKYPKNWTYLMVLYTYKNLDEKSEGTSGNFSIISDDTIYDMSAQWSAYWKIQMDFDISDPYSSLSKYIPPWTKRKIFSAFDVPLSVLDNWVIYIDWWYLWGEKVTVKLPIKELK